MSNLSGRRALNHISNLNLIPPEHDLEQDPDYTFSPELDLSDFANVDFVNWDGEDSNSKVGVSGDTAAIGGYASSNGNGAVGLEVLDFPGGEYSFATAPFNLAEQHHGLPALNNPAAYPQTLTSPTYSTASPSLDAAAHASPQSQSSPSFLPGHISNPNADPAEERARQAADEDKRRRNTAASARFRVKKKAREQELAQTNKELVSKVKVLEGRITALEQENGWLKNLVVEKKGQEELADKYQEFRRKSEEADDDDDRSTRASKKGVGTKDKKA